MGDFIEKNVVSGLIGAIKMLLNTIDLLLFKLINGVSTHWLEGTLPTLATVWGQLGCVGVMLLVAIIFSKKKIRRLGVVVLPTALLSGLIFIGGQSLFSSLDRKPPYESKLANSKIRAVNTLNTGTMPSLAPVVLFVLGMVASFYLPLLRPFFFIIVFLQGWSEIYAGLSFPLDILSGYVLAWLVAKIYLMFFAPKFKGSANG